MTNISDSIKRQDFDDKIQGKALYTADLWGEDKLYVKVFRSDRQRAKILNILIPTLPAGYEVIDHQQIPGINRVAMVYDDQPFLAENRVNYIGEPILLVVGQDRNIIKRIMTEIIVEYEDLPAINSIDESIARPALYTFADGKNAIAYSFAKGDTEVAIEKSKKAFEDRLQTGYQDHAYLEAHSFAAKVEDGIVTLHGSMQCPYYVLAAMTSGLGLDESKIRVIQEPTGGGFGGKEDYSSIPAVLCAVAAIKSGKPVHLIYDRQEDIVASTKRHPSDITIKSYLDDDNRITAMDIDIKLDGGAYAALSSVVLQRAIFTSTGVYNIENLKVKGQVYATNKVVSSGFRGFGGPQAIFAIEMHLENIALALGLDPLHFKSRHFLRDGDQSCTQGGFLNPLKLDQMAQSINQASSYLKKRKAQKSREKLSGTGFSMFAHGCGFTGDGEADVLKSKVKLKKHQDGRVEIFVANVEMGQGVSTTLAKIVAMEIGIPFETIIYKDVDTKYCPDSGPTAASRSVLIIGKMLQDCAREIKARWAEDEIEIIRTYLSPEGISWDDESFVGSAYPDYSWGAMVVDVQIDPVSYQVEVKKIWAEYDIGTAIDRRIVQGQIEGGILQGLGYSLMEEFDCLKGEARQKSFTTYTIPTAGDFPKPYIKLIENPRINGPFGGGGLGELPLVGVAPALASAIQNALGKKVSRIPITPEMIKELLDDKN